MYQNYFTDCGCGYNYSYPMPSAIESQKTYLANYKQYLLKQRNSVAEYAKQIEEALTVIDKEEAKLKKTEIGKKEQTKSGIKK